MTDSQPDVTGTSTVALEDFGDAARLERFGDRLVDRPHPGAFGARRIPERWPAADLRFDRDGGWSGPAELDPWSVVVDGVTMELRPTDAGQVGLFPEHVAMLPWLGERLAARAGRRDDGRSAVLHLFAYTGLVTLALAGAGAAVTHVDAARPSVAWARRNAERNGLADAPIRWIVDDARAFTEREARRGRRYAGLVLDPPSYGHGSGGRAWRIETDLEPLLGACRGILEPGAFVLLTGHTPAFGPEAFASILARGIGHAADQVETGGLGLTSLDGRRLELGAYARLAGSA